MASFYTADKIFDGYQWIEGILEIEKGRVQSVHEKNPTVQPKNFEGCSIVPAFIDVQIYGAHNKLFAVYPDADSLHKLYDYCRLGGAPLFLPTVATNSLDVFYKCIDAVRAYWAEGGKGLWGLHLEGPWINEAKRGAHVAAHIHKPSLQEAEELLAYGQDVIKMITLAPEVCSSEVIQLLLSKGIVVSAGHSNASYLQAVESFNNGIGAATHLYNAMSPLQHRAPGMVGACFLHPAVKASIIADGYHVDFEAIRIAKQLMGERLFIITDAVTDTNEGPYRHQRVGDRYECNGVLSGSAMTMYSSLLNLVKKVGVPLTEALRMCSLYPARVLGCDDQYGILAPGAVANFLVLDKDLGLVEVITG